MVSALDDTSFVPFLGDNCQKEQKRRGTHLPTVLFLRSTNRGRNGMVSFYSIPYSYMLKLMLKCGAYLHRQFVSV